MHIFMWLLLIHKQTFVESINCTKYESCFNTAINVTNNNGLHCYGAQSCIDCNIDTVTLSCDGYGTCSGDKSTLITNNTLCFGGNSCLHGNITSNTGISCDGYNTCSNSNVQLTSYSSPIWACESTHSCSNTIFKCETSYNDYHIINTRFIHVYLEGVFNGYNTRLYNNGNDIYILGRGYYSLYGLTVYCTSINSICIADCFGNGCVGLTLICDDSVLTCQYKCQDKECQSYKHLVTIYNNSDNDFNDNNHNYNINHESYDEIAILVNDILTHYDKNFTLFPASSVDLIESNGYCQNINNRFFFGDYPQVFNKTLIVNTNEHVCCLGTISCYKIIINTTDYDSKSTVNVYCGGVGSCVSSTFINVNIYSVGSGALLNSNVLDFDAIVACSAVGSCYKSHISNGSIVMCMSFKACWNTSISNVETAIAIGYRSLYNCQLINVQRIMLLSTQALSNTTISKIKMDNFELYCQNDDSMCHEITNYTKTGLYCYDSTSISINIDGIDFNAVNVSNLLYCSGNSYSPSISPTISPTESQFTHDIDLILSWIETSTAQIGIILATLAFVMVVLSIYFRKKKHSQTLQNYTQLNNDSTGIRMMLLNDLNDDDGENNRSNSHSSIMTYVKGFGYKASHLVIVQVLFEIYDVFTDVSYLLELYHNNLFKYFGAFFLSSLISTLIINGMILLYFLKNSFKYNKLFEQWFWNHSAIIISLMIFCLFTDVGLIISLLTSQIFGHLIFYAPLNLHDIKTIKSALILSIFIEHLPQLIVQCTVFFNQSQSTWSIILITSLSVTCIDTFITCIKIIIWFVITKQMKMDTK